MRADWIVVVGVCLATLGGGVVGCASRTVRPVADTSAASAGLGADLAAERDHAIALKTALEDSAAEIAKLRTEVGQVRAREAELRSTLEQARGQAPSAAKPPSSPQAPSKLLADRIASLEQEISRERQRRSELETELARLKEETSSRPFATAGKGDGDIELLRRQLDEERSERRRLMGEFNEIQDKAREATRGQPAAATTSSPVVRALRARLIELESRQQEAMVSLARTIAADRKREEQLTEQLSAATVQVERPAPVAPVAPIVAAITDSGVTAAGAEAAGENARLRSMLEEERQRNAELHAKLKLASRVTDLLFRMQKQESDGAPPPAPKQ